MLYSCAEMNGIDKPVIDRARDLSRLSAQGSDLVLACSKMDDAEAELLSQAVSRPPEFNFPEPIVQNTHLFLARDSPSLLNV